MWHNDAFFTEQYVVLQKKRQIVLVNIIGLCSVFCLFLFIFVSPPAVLPQSQSTESMNMWQEHLRKQQNFHEFTAFMQRITTSLPTQSHLKVVQYRQATQWKIEVSLPKDQAQNWLQKIENQLKETPPTFTTKLNEENVEITLVSALFVH